MRWEAGVKTLDDEARWQCNLPGHNAPCWQQVSLVIKHQRLQGALQAAHHTVEVAGICFPILIREDTFTLPLLRTLHIKQPRQLSYALDTSP